MTKPFSLRGWHYRSESVYNLFAWLKLRSNYNQRFQLAVEFIKETSSVVDFCAGTGRLKDFINPKCAYKAVEASGEFCKILEKRKIDHLCWNLHKGWPESIASCETIVMLISLAQFRKTSVVHLLECFKRKAQRVIIIEEVLEKERTEESIFQRIVNYLCDRDYYIPVSWYTRQEFFNLMTSHGYKYQEITKRYCVGIYERK